MSNYLATILVSIYRFFTPVKKGLLLTFFGTTYRCKHQIPCSEYLLTVVKKQGWRGFFLALGRILTCC